MRPRKVREDWRGQRLMAHAPDKRVEPESSVQRRIVEALWACGGVHVMRNNVGATRLKGHWVRFGLERGSADLICVVAPFGRLLAIECKRPKGSRFEDGQEAWLTKMRNYGAVAGVARSPEEALELVKLARRSPFADEEEG